MASGIITFTTGNKYIDGRIEWNSKSNGSAANTSTVTATLSFKKSSSSTDATTGNFSGTLSIDGTATSLSKRITLSPNNVYVVIGSATKTVTHNSDGTKSIRIESTGGISGLSFNYSKQGQTVALDTIPRQATVTGANNFNDEQNPYMTFTNAGGFVMNAKLEAAGVNPIVSRSNIPNTGNYTFALTEAERNLLRSKCPNSNTLTVRYTIETIISGQSYYSYVDRTMSIVNATPTAGSLSYQDINSATVAITEDNQRIIRNCSLLRAIIGTATAKKGASISSYSTTINGITKTGNGNVDFGALNISQNATMTTTITDSRGNKTTASVNVIFDDWELPNGLITLERQNKFEATTYLKVDAIYKSLNGKNSVNITYQYKKTSDSTYGTATAIANNTQISLTLDRNYSFDFKIVVNDRLGSTILTTVLPEGKPIIFFDTKKRSLGVDCFPKENGSVEVSGLRIDSPIYIGSQVLYDSYSTTAAGLVSVLGAYDYRLVQGIFSNISIPENYVRAYRITAQVQTSNENTAQVYLNNIATNARGTWSGATFREPIGSRIFKESELTLEAVFNYASKQGLNLKINNSAAFSCNVYNITLHGYLVKATATNTINITDNTTPIQA